MSQTKVPNEMIGNVLLADTTVTIPAGSASAQIQAYIDAQPKDLNGHALTFQFEAGTYDVPTTPLTFSGFKNGSVSVLGDASVTSASESQNVILQCDVDAALKAVFCDTIAFKGFNGYRTTEDNSPIIHVTTCNYAYVRGCYLHNDNASKLGSGVAVLSARTLVEGSRVAGLANGVYADRSTIYVKDCDSKAGALPGYGMYAYAGRVVKMNGNVPTGDTNEGTAGGGQIV